MENTEGESKEPIKTQTRRRDFCAAHVTKLSYLKVHCMNDLVMGSYSPILSTEIQAKSENLYPLSLRSPSVALPFRACLIPRE
jgi:hypothetical protein